MITATSLGLEIKSQVFTACFGNKSATLDRFKEAYPDFSFQTMHQVHGDTNVELKSFMNTEPQADALVTSSPKIALIVKSADCLPILIVGNKGKKIAAIHAGWRGIENRIFVKTANKHFPHDTGLSVYVGPHILFSSFEVSTDVKDLLLESAKVKTETPDLVKPKENGKYLVNLFGLLQFQLQELKVESDHLQAYLEDTVTSNHLNSFRRDAKNAGRNLSFIALN
ncbi:MAG: polyphenol oxidase family protein [Bdellovibrionota bacterium]